VRLPLLVWTRTICTAFVATIELFDLAVDPGEWRSLADAHPDKVRELRARYEMPAKQAVPPKLEPRDPNFKTPKVRGKLDWQQLFSALHRAGAGRPHRDCQPVTGNR
jgi:hypothetical protein